MSKRYSGKSFKDSSVMKKPKLTFKEKKEIKRGKKKVEKVSSDLGYRFEEMNDYFLRFPHLIEWTSPTNETTVP